MDATITIKLKPWIVPNFARRDRGRGHADDDESIGIPLSDLSPETLDKMCDEFRREVFKKAGQREPDQPTYAPSYCSRCDCPLGSKA